VDVADGEGVKHLSPRWDGVQFIAAGECSKHFSTCKRAEFACNQRRRAIGRMEMNNMRVCCGSSVRDPY
jgi:hypothetical protein